MISIPPITFISSTMAYGGPEEDEDQCARFERTLEEGIGAYISHPGSLASLAPVLVVARDEGAEIGCELDSEDLSIYSAMIASDTYQAAVSAFEHGYLLEAAEELDLVERLGFDSLDFHLKRGKIYWALNESVYAALEFYNVLDFDDDHLPALFALTQFHVESGLYDIAGGTQPYVLGNPQLYRESETTIASAYRQAAVSSYYQGSLAEVEEYLLTSYVIKPNEPDTLYSLTAYYSLIGEVEESYKYFCELLLDANDEERLYAFRRIFYNPDYANLRATEEFKCFADYLIVDTSATNLSPLP
ncbi:MAG: hypothetical protein ABIE84_04910 [bacterium]